MFLRKLWCWVVGGCPARYNRTDDPIFKRYVTIENRVNNLWRPRELFDVH